MDTSMFTIISVQNPVLEIGRYTSYEISLETNDSCFTIPKSVVRRRYSEFVKLYNMLLKHHPCLKPPILPGKDPFKNRFKEDFVERRRNGLQQFLEKLIAIPMYMSNRAVHLFIQSSFNMNEINNIIQGKMPIDENVFNGSQSIQIRVGDSHTQNNLIEDDKYEVETHVNFVPLSDECSPCSDSEETTAHVSLNCNSIVSNPEQKSNVIPSGKKVSFCNEVTVAQVYVEKK